MNPRTPSTVFLISEEGSSGSRREAGGGVGGEEVRERKSADYLQAETADRR